MAQSTIVGAFNSVLKDIYQGPIREQLNEHTELLDIFTKGEIDQYEWQGNQMIIPLHKSRNAGVMATTEDGYLPSAGKQGYAKLAVPMKFLRGRIELTAQVMKASRSDKGSFARAMDTEQKGLVNDMARYRNRVLAGFGRGILAIINGSATNVQQTVDSPGGVAGTVNPTRFLKAGMTVAIVEPSAGTVRGISTISSIDSATTFTMADSIAATDNDVVVSAVSYGVGLTGNSLDNEPMGILGLADSTTYASTVFGLDRSTAANAFFRSTVMTSVGNLSEDLLQRGLDNVQEVSGEVPDVFLCHVSVRRELLKLTQADRRYNVSPGQTPKNFDSGTEVGGFKADYVHNGIPVKTSKDFAYGTLVGANKKHLFWVPQDQGSWAQEDGTILLRVSNKDNYEARFRVDENVVSDKGNALLRMDGINSTITSLVWAD